MKVKKRIDDENRLFIEVKEEISSEKAKKNPKLKLFFYSNEEDRRIPMKTEVIKDKDGKAEVVGKASILLPYVFFHEIGEEEVKVLVEMYYEGKREEIGEAFFLTASHFHKTLRMKKNNTILLWIPAFFLIPFSILSSWLAGKRGREVIRYANQRIKEWTGMTFSIREYKTNYFRKMYETYKKLPLKKNGVLFLSERKMEEGGNLSFLYQAIKKEKDRTLFSFIVEKPVHKLKFRELRESARLIAEARFIILEDFYPQLHALVLRQETKVIQLWHACGAFKTFGFSRLHQKGGPEEDSTNHRSYHKVFVSSEKMIPYYSEAFAIPEKNILPLGTPRTDVFFDEEYKHRVRERWYQQFPYFKGKKIVLFAPTFRGHGNKDAFYPDTAFSVEDFMEKMPEDVILLIKHHPFVKENISIPSRYQKSVLDVSKSFSINDLLFVTNLLVTDYSSSVFEAVLLNLPILFYVFDEEDYRKDRDIYGDFDFFLPGRKVKTKKELKDVAYHILMEKESGSSSDEEFKEFYLSSLDGHSTERIATYILRMIKEEGE